MCNTNNCPTGVATQKPELRVRLDVAIGASKLSNFLNASTQLLQVLARACGHTHLSQFDRNDITRWKKEMADLTGLDFAGYNQARATVSLRGQAQQRPEPPQPTTRMGIICRLGSTPKSRVRDSSSCSNRMMPLFNSAEASGVS